MKLNSMTSAALLILAGCTMYGAHRVSAEEPKDETEMAFPVHTRESEMTLLRWNVHGCTDGQDCARFEDWARSRFYFAGSDLPATDDEISTFVQTLCNDLRLNLTEQQCETLYEGSYL